MAELPREVQPGEPITAAWANSLVRFIRQVGEITVGYPLQLSRGSHGSHISMPPIVFDHLIELTEALSSGSNADAKLLTWDGTNWTTTGAKTIKVYDSVGGSRDGASGDRGWAFFSGESARWELKVLGC